MATELLTPVPEVCFSSEFPDLRLRTDVPLVEAQLYAGKFSLDLLANLANGEVSFCDFGRALTDDLAAGRTVARRYTLEILGGNIGMEFFPTVVYCAYRMPEADCAAFLRTHFLTALSAKALYAALPETLTCLVEAEETISLRAVCHFADGSAQPIDNLPHTAEAQAGYTPYTRLTLRISLAEIEAQVGKNIAALTVEVGSRRMTYYRAAGRPAAVFRFLSAWNAPELLPLFAVTAVKTEVSRQLAAVGGRSEFYDSRTEKTYEVETAALTADFAVLAEQFVASPYVELLTPQGKSLGEVLITDSECNFSDDDTEPSRLKFTWRFADDTPQLHPLSLPEGGIFTAPFDPAYA